ncbi:MAG: cyclic nucleotide-binding domain-containing protein [Burkholderiales bacterium]|nr:cyclic nucleotide-binding domain-containing protein [Burkholderiales bacterium]
MTNEVLDVRALLDPLAGRLPLLRDALLADSSAGFEPVSLSAGGVLLRAGEPAQALYVVAKGTLRATIARDDGSQFAVGELGPGEIAGELAILTGGGEYGATVSAVTDAVLVRVPRASFERMAAASPAALREMAGGIRQRLAFDTLAVDMPKLFGPVDAEMLHFVESRVQWLQVAAGERLFSEGDKGEDLYFVVGGRLRAIAPDGRVLSEMTRGESIGEMALLTGEPRAASVVAVRDSALVRVSRQAFDEIVAKYPQVLRTIARIVIHRLRVSARLDSAGRACKCIAVLAINDSVSAAQFSERLVAAFATVGPTLHLSSERVDRLLNRPGIACAGDEEPAGIRLTTWLDQQESSHQVVVFESDRTDTAWTRRCLRQADEVLLVADAASDPGPGALERSLLAADGGISRARQNLILLHPRATRMPTGTARWFAGRDIRRNFHVRADDNGDYGRLARSLGDAAVGLVLGGGGARGLAHIGVVRAMREAGMHIDVVGGTSMGAVMASLVAMGQDWNEMLETNRDAWMRHKPHKEYSLPMISLIRSRRLDAMAQKIWGEIQIEDLWLDYFCISCNLSNSATIVHTRGPLWKAVRASASIPGVFVPVLSDGHILVDGGVVNNLPEDVMRERACRSVVVVDVGSEQEFVFKSREFPSPWQFLKSRLFRSGSRVAVPHIVDVLMRTVDVSSSELTREARKHADLCLRPPIDRYGTLQFEALDEIAKVGYRYASAKLEEMRREPTFAALFEGGGAIRPAVARSE